MNPIQNGGRSKRAQDYRLLLREDLAARRPIWNDPVSGRVANCWLPERMAGDSAGLERQSREFSIAISPRAGAACCGKGTRVAGARDRLLGQSCRFTRLQNQTSKCLHLLRPLLDPEAEVAMLVGDCASSQDEVLFHAIGLSRSQSTSINGNTDVNDYPKVHLPGEHSAKRWTERQG